MTFSLNPRISLIAAIAVALAIASPGTARAADYVPGEVIVGTAPGPFPSVTGDVANQKGTMAVTSSVPAPQTLVLKLPPGVSVTAAVDRLRRKPGVSYAVPNYVAHADGMDWVPNDPGRAHRRGGWERLQWNFLSAAGVNAPQAWANLRADRRPGGRGVTVADP